MKKLVKSGKLANGYERDKGRVAHFVPDGNTYAGPALCGTAPSNQWVEVKDFSRDCPRCARAIAILKCATRALVRQMHERDNQQRKDLKNDKTEN